MRRRLVRGRNRLLRRAAGLVPAGVLHRATEAAGWAAQYGGRTRHASDTLRRALEVILEPPRWQSSDEARPLDAEAIADRLSLDPEEVARWGGWGLLGDTVAPGSPRLYSANAATERARLVAYLLRHGVDEAAIREAASEDRLAMLIVDRAISGRGSLSAEEVARRAGVDRAFSDGVWRALGMPMGDDSERHYSRREVEAMRLIGVLRVVFSDEEIVEAVSVIGRGMAQIAATEVELFRRAVAARFAEQGMGELDAALRSAALVDLMVAPSRILLDVAHRRHLESATRAESAVRIEEATGRLPDQSMAAVGFADLVGFTAASERLSPLQLGELSSRLLRCAETVVPEHRARIVKSIGDAVMLSARTAAEACAAAVELVRATEAAGLPPLHVGIAYGPVLARHGDLFGRTVNVASRLCAAAPGGTVLLARSAGSDHLAEELAVAGLTMGEVRSMTLRGLGAAVEAVPVTRPAVAPEEPAESAAAQGAAG